MSNPIHSIQDRLRREAKKTLTDFQMILIRYFQERLLYRLANSAYKNKFCLKGGALLYAYEKEKSRLTLDLDLSARKMKPDQEIFRNIFLEICGIPSEQDCVSFDLPSLKIKDIKGNDKYAGLRITVVAYLGNIQQKLQIDIGFGDVITPYPVMMDYPTLLPMPAPELLAYSVETVIAEKFEAMISLAEANSRMKDFYDVYRLLISNCFNRETLIAAIGNTFQNRGTICQIDHPLFFPSFSTDKQRVQMWLAFLKRSKLAEGLAFETVHHTITEHLKPIYESLE